MKFWEDIITKASLGSAKMPLELGDLPEIVASEFEFTEATDKEENFLRLTTLAYQFRQGGINPLSLKNITQTEAELESRQYCSSKANDSLKAILEEELPAFVELWLKLCQKNSQLVHPEMIPVLFDLALKKKDLRPLITDVAGKRGAWLSRLNSDWNFFVEDEDPKTNWETGAPELRKMVLTTLREKNPAEGLVLLQSTWETEGANEKVSFLELLRTNLSIEDLSWLQNLKEKGQKVNAAILDLLKSIPGSDIVTEYERVVASAITAKTGKALLGMVNKTVLSINEKITVPDAIFKTGIQKLSSDKTISDEHFILFQLVSSVPPSFWSTHLQLSPQEVIDLFQKEKSTGRFVRAIALAAVRFKDLQWIKTILDHGNDEFFFHALVPLINSLPPKEKQPYVQKYVNEAPEEITRMMLESDDEWNLDVAKSILKHTAKEIYHYNKNFYKPAAALIPIAVLDILDSLSPSEEQKKTYWKTQSDELARLLTLKKQTLQSFNA